MTLRMAARMVLSMAGPGSLPTLSSSPDPVPSGTQLVSCSMPAPVPTPQATVWEALFAKALGPAQCQPGQQGSPSPGLSLQALSSNKGPVSLVSW